MKEIYKEIDGFPNYEVSNTGKVRNKKFKREKALGNDSHGYLKVDLYNGCVRTTRKVHRLVADAFLPKDPWRGDINHKDGNKHNNNVKNLERCTKSENIKHAYKNGLNKPHASYGMLGKKNPNGGRKKRPIMIIETRETFESIQECERRTGLNNRHINDCLRGRQKSHKGYHFKYI